MRLAPQRFEELAVTVAADLLDGLPPELRAEAATVTLAIAAEAPDPDLLACYEGVPLVERSADSVLWEPDRITLFQQPLQNMARTELELRLQLRRTLIHELAHFFGFSEDELEQRGWA